MELEAFNLPKKQLKLQRMNSTQTNLVKIETCTRQPKNNMFNFMCLKDLNLNS